MKLCVVTLLAILLHRHGTSPTNATAMRQYFHAHSSFRNSVGQISGITFHRVGVATSSRRFVINQCHYREH